MIQMMVAAPRSGGGKTTVTCALLRALQRRGLEPCAFKCGPDYIDPMFSRAVLGVESRNLDLFLSDEACVRKLYARGCQGHGAAVIEGVMGYYDGVSGASDRASSWHVADTLDVPVLLVVRAKGASLTLAAEIKGLTEFRPDGHIVGAVLDECDPKLCKALAPALERETGLPVLGCLPPMEEARVGSRHLGLRAATEIEGFDRRVDALAEALERHVDVNGLLSLCARGSPAIISQSREWKEPKIRIAVAADKAFSFIYQESLEVFQNYGAEIVPFSPLDDAAPPGQVGGLYLPGGYPELHVRALSANRSMIRSIKAAVTCGMPTVAECGGFLYLGAALCDGEGNEFPMAGVLPGRAANTGHLARFGYLTLYAEAGSLLFRAGERVPAHEFHYWDSTDCGDALRAEKGGRSWRCGFVSDTLYAAFPHLYFAGRPELAERFVAAARHYGEAHGFAGDH